MRLPDPAAPRPGIDPAPIRPLSIQRLCPACEDKLYRPDLDKRLLAHELTHVVHHGDAVNL